MRFCLRWSRTHEVYFLIILLDRVGVTDYRNLVERKLRIASDLHWFNGRLSSEMKMKDGWTYGMDRRNERRAKTMPISKIGTSSVKRGSGVVTGEIV
jgi:hypothetical protein